MLPRHSHDSLSSSGNRDCVYNSSIHWEATAGCNGTFMQRQQEESASREHESRPDMSNRLWRFGASLPRLALRLSPQPPWNHRLSPVGPRHARRTRTRSKGRHENACFAGCTKSAASLDLWHLNAAVDSFVCFLVPRSRPSCRGESDTDRRSGRLGGAGRRPRRQASSVLLLDLMDGEAIAFYGGSGKRYLRKFQFTPCKSNNAVIYFIL